MVRRVVDADVSAERPPVPDLDVRHRRGDLGEDRSAHLDLGRAHDRGERRHRADLERRAGDGDRPELVEIGEVDQHVGRGGPLLHDVDERLAPREGTCPVVLAEEETASSTVAGRAYETSRSSMRPILSHRDR